MVTPQVQRLGSFRRASRMYKQHWSKQHVVRVREMPDAWTTEQGRPQQPTQRARRWAGQWGADIARYLCQRPPAGGWRDRHPWAEGYLGTKQPWRSKVTPARAPSGGWSRGRAGGTRDRVARCLVALPGTKASVQRGLQGGR